MYGCRSAYAHSVRMIVCCGSSFTRRSKNYSARYGGPTYRFRAVNISGISGRRRTSGKDRAVYIANPVRNGRAEVVASGHARLMLLSILRLGVPHQRVPLQRVKITLGCP